MANTGKKQSPKAPAPPAASRTATPNAAAPPKRKAAKGAAIAAPKEHLPTTAKQAGSRASSKAHPSFEEISLRAYFISEHRQHHGIPGDSTADWAEAERQLFAERQGRS